MLVGGVETGVADGPSGDGVGAFQEETLAAGTETGEGVEADQGGVLGRQAAGFVLAPGEEGRPPIEVEAEGGAPRPKAGEEVTPPVLRYAPSEAKVPVVVSDPSLL